MDIPCFLIGCVGGGNYDVTLFEKREDRQVDTRRIPVTCPGEYNPDTRNQLQKAVNQILREQPKAKIAFDLQQQLNLQKLRFDDEKKKVVKIPQRRKRPRMNAAT